MKKQNQRKINLWLVIAAVNVLSVIVWFSMQDSEKTSEEAPAQLAAVKYPTLPPSMFTGTTREAYQVAQDIPEVLKEVQCYCGCRQENGHQNNLFCFTDQHGVGCEMCQNIAFDARKMHDAGLPTNQIREAIRIKYEHSGQ